MFENREWVLLLDDDAAFRGLISSMLTAMGCSVYETSSAREASQALSLKAPALAIVDYRLPDLDGITWISRVREQGHNFPIVFVSATWCDNQAFNRLRNLLKVALILQKPIVPELFLEQVETLLPKGSSAAQPEDVNASAAAGWLRRSPEAQDSQQDIGLMLRQEVRHPKSVEDALKVARQDYAKELPPAIKELAQTVRNAKEMQDRGLLLSAIHLAHKLRGSAGSFGFNGISEGSAKIENLLRSLEQDDSTMQDILWSEIIRILSEIETGAQAATVEMGIDLVEAQARPLPRHVLAVGPAQRWAELTNTLESASIATVSVAESVPDAIVSARSIRPDALFLDLSQLNKGLVIDLLKGIRSIENCDSVPFALVPSPNAVPSEAEALFVGASIVFHGALSQVSLNSAAVTLIAIREAFMPRVLSVDDDEILGNFIKSVLAPEGMVVETLQEPIRILEVLDEFMPDVMLLDVIMPAISGYDVCRMIRQSESWRQLRILFLTSKSSAEGRAAAFKAGGDDFLGKPVVSEEVMARVKTQLDRASSYRDRLEKDSLTGVLQRTPFERAACGIVDAARGRRTAVTLALLEVNHFRELSGVYGLGMGERLLAELGTAVKARFRSEDVRARLGDFIVLVFPGQDNATVEEALNMLKGEFEQIAFQAPDQSSFTTSINFGTAELWNDCEDAVGLIKAASQKLLSKKAEALQSS